MTVQANRRAWVLPVGRSCPRHGENDGVFAHRGTSARSGNLVTVDTNSMGHAFCDALSALFRSSISRGLPAERQPPVFADTAFWILDAICYGVRPG